MSFKWFIENLWQILINVIGGFLTVLLTIFLTWVKNNYTQSKFKSVFGEDVGKSDFRLIYAEFIMDKTLLKNKDDHFLYIKKPIAGGLKNYRLSIDNPVSSCEIRSANYLSSTIGRVVKLTPTLTSDVLVSDRLDMSFIALGSPASNCKANDLDINQANEFVKFSNFIKSDNQNDGYDYGLIIKINPEQFPNRAWIACYGRAECGTSGAAWYLANRWKEIYEYAGKKPFGITVKVKPGQDEFATVIARMTI